MRTLTPPGVGCVLRAVSSANRRFDVPLTRTAGFAGLCTEVNTLSRNNQSTLTVFGPERANAVLDCMKFVVDPSRVCDWYALDVGY